MEEEYSHLPYIGKKRAKRLRDAGITLENIAEMTEIELKNYLKRISNAKLKEIISVAKEIVAQARELSDNIGIDYPTAKSLVLKGFSLQKLAETPTEEIANVLGIDAETAFKLKFKANASLHNEPASVELNRELMNHTVIISRNGFVNGFTPYRKYTTVKRRLPVLAFVIAFMIVLTVFGGIYLLKPKIAIDGVFSDWNTVKGYTDVNGLSYKFFNQNGAFYFYVSFPGLFTTNSSVYILIDTGDGGYYANGIYANYVIEVYGWNSTVKGGNLWECTDTGNLWNFTRISGLRFAGVHGAVEGAVDMPLPKFTRLFVVIKEGDKRVVSPVVYPFIENPVVLIKSTSDILKNDTVFYELSVISPRKIDLTGLRISMDNCTVKSLYAVVDNKKYSGHNENGVYYVSLSLTVNGKLQISLEGEFDGSPGNAVFPKIQVVSEYSKITYYNETSGMYLFSPPSNVKIDGAFADWKYRKTDIAGDVDDENIDLVDYSYTSDLSKIYFSVIGEFMGGDDVPLERVWHPRDPDRDSVPDSVDPYPHDFNNDGIPDSKSFVRVGNDELPDVDGDGIPDYPYGSDVWLNTTIPDNFPKPYAGRKVSVYIGPAHPPKPRNGNDTAEIYIGNGDSEGAYVEWVPFHYVDYKVVITGRDGKYRASLYAWDGKWVFKKIISDIQAGYHAVELDTGVPLTRGNVWITVFNWHGDEDYPSYSARTRATVSENVFYLHGAYQNTAFNNMNWTIGTNAISDTLYKNDVREWFYENPLYMNYTISAATVYLNLTTVFTSGTNQINASLYAARISGGAVIQESLLMWNNVSVTGNVSSSATIINLTKIVNTTVLAGFFIELKIEYYATGSFRTVIIDYNSTQYDSRLVISTNTTIKIKNVWTENSTAQTTIFSSGDEVFAYANVTDPLGYKHIKSAFLNILTPNTTYLYPSQQQMYICNYSDGYIIFNFTLNLPANASVGYYYICISAYDVENNSDYNDSHYFLLMWNVTIQPHTNSSVGNVIYYYHLIRNNGTGYDIFNINITSTASVNVTLYCEINGIWYLMAYSDTGTGWSWVNASFDRDGDGLPDTGYIAPGGSFTIILKVNTTVNETTNITVYDSLSAYDSASDITTIPENTALGMLVMISLICVYSVRRKNKKRV